MRRKEMIRTLATGFFGLATALAGAIWVASHVYKPNLYRLDTLGLSGATIPGKIVIFFSYCPTCNQLGNEHRLSCAYHDLQLDGYRGFQPPSPPDFFFGPVAITRISSPFDKYEQTWELQSATWFLFAIAAFPLSYSIIRKNRRTIENRRRRGLCVKCGYNLTGNATGVCPECGTKFETLANESPR
jgi:hypothetical protein